MLALNPLGASLVTVARRPETNHGRSETKDLAVAPRHAPLGRRAQSPDLCRGQGFGRATPPAPCRPQDRHVPRPTGPQGEILRGLSAPARPARAAPYGRRSLLGRSSTMAALCRRSATLAPRIPAVLSAVAKTVRPGSPSGTPKVERSDAVRPVAIEPDPAGSRRARPPGPVRARPAGARPARSLRQGARR